MGISVWRSFHRLSNINEKQNKLQPWQKEKHTTGLELWCRLPFLLVWRQQEYKKTKQDQWQEDEKSMECQQTSYIPIITGKLRIKSKKQRHGDKQ